MQTVHDAIGVVGREPQRPLLLIATAAAKPFRGRPPRHQEHLTTAGRETMSQVDMPPPAQRALHTLSTRTPRSLLAYDISPKDYLLYLSRNDYGNKLRDYPLQIALETSRIADKSTWVVNETEKPLASLMLSILGYVDAQLLSQLLIS